jgi:hypothetical protein
MMRVRRLTLTGVVTLGVLFGGMLLATSALANYIGGSPASFGSFPGLPFGVAVERVSHDVYVADANGVVYKLNGKREPAGFSGLGSSELVTAGAPGTPYGLAVDNSGTSTQGEIYVANLTTNVVERYDPAGAKDLTISGPPFVEPTGVAVDSSGDVYVADYHHGEGGAGKVYEFSSSGSSLNGGAPVLGGLTKPNTIASNSKGDLYVAETSVGTVEFAPNGHGGFDELTPTTIDSASTALGVAVDQQTNRVFVANESFAEAFSEDGTPIGRFGSLATSFAVAVNEPTKEVFVTDSPGGAGTVDVFVPEQPLSARTEPATEVTKTTAKLHAMVALEGGGKVKYHFDYGTTTAYGTETPEEEVTVTAGAPEAQVTVEIPPLLAPPLAPSTPYHYKIVATDTKPELAEGRDETLNTQGPPIVISESATAVKVSEATLQATINPNNQETTCRFEYASSAAEIGTSSATTVPCEQASLGHGFGAQPASAHIEHLQGGTTYHYRVVAENAVKETSAPSEGTGEFTTAAAQDAVIEGESVSVESEPVPGHKEVTFTAQVNPELQLTTSCAFEYGKLGGPYEASVPCEQSSAQIGDGSTGVSVEANLAGLEAGVDYHYRFVVKNATGTTEGADQVFGPPVVVTGAVLSEVPGVAPSTTATVGGELNAESLDAHYYVQYGTESEGYAQSAPFLPLGVPLPQGIDAGSGTAPVVLGGAGAPPDVSLEGLTPGALYRYRLVAYNADGTAYGAPMTVMVPPAPSVGPASVLEVAQSSVTISTSVNPQGLHTLYKLDLGTSSAYGTPYPGDAGSGSAAVPLTFNLTGLEPGTVYHFRLMASSSDGTSSESDQTFTTASSPLGVLPVFSVPPSPSLVPFTALAFPGESRTVAKKKAVKKKTVKKKTAKKGKKGGKGKKGKKGGKGGKGNGHGKPNRVKRKG